MDKLDKIIEGMSIDELCGQVLCYDMSTRRWSDDEFDTIAKETGASIYTLDPIVTGDANEDAYDDYIVKMQENLNTLKEALK